MDRAEKSETVATLNALFRTPAPNVVAHYAGLTVAAMTALRARMRTREPASNAKNRLASSLKGTEAEGTLTCSRSP